MSELVETLRFQSAEISSVGIAGWGNTMADAADEINRLRAELAELRRFRKAIMDYDSNLYDALANSDAARKGEEE